MKFLGIVEIVAQSVTWGHPPRKEIIGQTGIVFGTSLPSPAARHLDHVKCYVYIASLGQTYGIAAQDLRPVDGQVELESVLPEFAAHFLGFFSYAMGDRVRRTPESFPEFRAVLAKIEPDYPREALLKCIDYGLNDVSTTNRGLFRYSDQSDDVVRAYLLKYRDALSEGA